ncbi:unnamed protein product, partial [Brassica rapa]
RPQCFGTCRKTSGFSTLIGQSLVFFPKKQNLTELCPIEERATVNRRGPTTGH